MNPYPNRIDGHTPEWWQSRSPPEIVRRMFEQRTAYLTLLEALSITLPDHKEPTK